MQGTIPERRKTTAIAMITVDKYLDAANRENTRRSYASDIRHFEESWGGYLPATVDSVSRYLAAHAESLSLNTLKRRLAALSRWHQDQGFPDPTKTATVRQVLKGIRALHPEQEKRARPLELLVLQQVSEWLEDGIAVASERKDRGSALSHARNRAMLLLGFWRGFRSDELVNLRVENLKITPGEGLVCYLPRSKGDRQMQGREYSCPALSRLCPVDAVSAWLSISGLSNGPLFRAINRWGYLSDRPLLAASIIPMLRSLLAQAGIKDAKDYSSHSLRRGFAGWARTSGWDIRELMNYVGWRDIKTAMRYLDGADAGLKARFELGLGNAQETTKPSVKLPQKPAKPLAPLEVSIELSAFSGSERGAPRVLRLIVETCLAKYQAQKLDDSGSRYRILVPDLSREILDEHVYALLDDMHQVADANRFFLETACRNPATGDHWD
jgi:site-specific recombinase XerD